MNDVPLIQKADINSINTSIIAIKKQLKQLTEAVGLIDVPDVDTSVFVKKTDVADIVEADNMNPVTSNAVAEYTVDEVTSGNMHSVSSNAVAQLLQKYEFSGTTDFIGELEISSALPINAVPVCAMSKVGGNIQMIPVTYSISGTKYYYIQVWNDRTNTVRNNFACQGIVYYLLAPSS